MKKFLKISGITLLVLFLVLLIVPFFFKGEVVRLIQEQANNSLNATLRFDEDIHLSLIRNFPNLSLGIDQLSIVGKGDFEGDTLISLASFRTTLDVMSVIKGDQIKIKSLELNEPRVFVTVLKNGKASYDIALPDTAQTATTPEDTGTTRFNIALQEYAINNATLVYDDQSSDLYTRVDHLTHNGKGDFTQDVFQLETHTSIEALDLVMSGVKYMSRVKTGLDLTMEINNPEAKYTFKDNELRLNELALGFDGWLAMPGEDINMDMKFNAKKTDFRNILSLVPGVFTKDFEGLKASGKLALDGTVKGTYNASSIPAYTAKLLIENGAFQYPDLPSSVKDVQVNLLVQNPDGVTDHTIVDLSRFHAVIAESPIDAKLNLRNPVSDPLLDLMLKGKLDLGVISTLVPLDSGMALKGLVDANLEAKGLLSAAEKQDMDKFYAAGKLDMKDIYYNSADVPMPVDMKTALLEFDPKKVAVKQVDLKMGESDFKMDGQMDNLFGYLFHNEALKGNLDLKSTQINANQFLSEEEAAPAAAAPAPQDTVPLTAFEVPENLDFALDLQVDRLLYDNLELKNMKGQAQIVNESMILKGLVFNLLDAAFVMKGSYSSVDPQKPLVDFAFSLKDLEIPKAFQYFNTVQKLAPIAQYMQGKMSIPELKLKSVLGQDMSPLMSSLDASGVLNALNVTVSGFKPIEAIADQLKTPQYKKLDIKKILLTFKVIEGKVINAEDLDINSGNINMKILAGGYTTLEQALNYAIKVKIPRKEFGSQANQVVNDLVSKAATAGVKINPGETVDLDLALGGTVTDPKVSLNFKDAAGSAKDALIEQLDAKKQELIDKGKAEADKLKAEAEAKAKAEEEKLRQQADAEKKRLEEEAARKKAEAEAKAKAEAEAAKKKAEEEAKKKLKGLIKQ